MGITFTKINLLEVVEVPLVLLLEVSSTRYIVIGMVHEGNSSLEETFLTPFSFHNSLLVIRVSFYSPRQRERTSF